MKLLPVGSEAPDFEAPSQDGTTVRLRDLRGRWVVLYFYPRDHTYGCTREACAFRDDYVRLQAEGADVLGVSRDDEAKHREFAAKHGLPFRILADPKQQIISAYGAAAWYGVAHRVTYIIDPYGRIAHVYRHVTPHGHSNEVLDDLRRLKQESNAAVPNLTNAP